MSSISQGQGWHPTWARLRRPLAMAAMICGALGLVVCVVTLVVLWSLYGPLTTWVDTNLAQVERLLLRGDAGLTTLTDTVSSTRERARNMVQQAATIQQNVAPDDATRTRLAASLTAIDGQYAALREHYIAARERVSGLVELTDQWRRMPFVSIPELPLAQLEALDTRLVEADQAITALRSSVNIAPGTLDTLARSIGEQAQQLDSRLVALEQGVTTVQGRLGELRTTLATTRADFAGWVRLIFSLLSLLLLWIGFLHVSLFYQGRFFWRPDPQNV